MTRSGATFKTSAWVSADHLGDDWKGYVLKIAGGNDKQGFPENQGVLINTLVRLLLKHPQAV